MRLVTWCEPEWDGKRWEVRQITEYFPNLFARLVLRRTAKTETRTFQLTCNSRTALDQYSSNRWMEVWPEPDGTGRRYLPSVDGPDGELCTELFDRVRCVMKTGSIEELMDDPDRVLARDQGPASVQDTEPKISAVEFDKKVDEQLVAALHVKATSPEFVQFQQKLREIRNDRLRTSLAIDELEREQKIAQRPPPRTLASLLASAGVKPTPIPPHLSAVYADVTREAGKIIAFQNKLAMLNAEDHINYEEQDRLRQMQELAMAPGPGYTIE